MSYHKGEGNMIEKIIFKGNTDPSFDNSSLLNEALKEAQGNTLIISSGTYHTTPINIPSNTHLILEEGAILSFIPDFSAYSAVETWWEGVPSWAMHPCLFISNEENIVIEGEGKINGNGRAWWDYITSWKEEGRKRGPELPIEKELALLNSDYLSEPDGGGGRKTQFLRPPLLQIYKSKNVTIRGITLLNSPFWTLHPLLSEDITIENVKINNPRISPNTDGIDIEMCQRVVINKCDLSIGDDGIAIKSGSGPKARKMGKKARDITIQNSIVRYSHGGVVIGSETACGVEDVFVSNCLFSGTDRGLRIKTRRGRGGVIKNIVLDNVEVRDSICPIAISMFYRCGIADEKAFSPEKQEITDLTPQIKDITINNIRAYNSRHSAAFIVGLPERPIENVTISNSILEVKKEREEGLEAEMVLGVKKSDCRGIREINAEVALNNVSINAKPEVEYN